MNIIIAGGNAAGMSATSRLRKNLPDANIIVLEKGNLVSFGACGLPYFVAGEFDNQNEMIARPLEAFQKINIDVRLFHEAISLDPQAKTISAKNTQTQEIITLPYDKLLISTGAVPFIPNIEGIDLQGVHTLTKMEDGMALRAALPNVEKVVIIGGGFIGLETAEAMLHQGKDVTIIELDSRVSSRVFDPEITEHLENAIRKHGVNLRLEEKVIKFSGKKKIQFVHTNTNTYAADLVIIAAGFSPATQWCQNIGLEMLPNGAIIIDDQGKTNIKEIYAAGDCATIKHSVLNQQRYIPLATSANKLGRCLGDILAGKNIKFQGTLGSSALRFMDFEAGRTGISEHEAQSAGYNYSTNTIQDFNHTSYVPGKTPLYIKLIYDNDSRILLGGQICGPQDAVLRVDALASAIFKKTTVDELGMLDFIYAPPFARTWEAMNIAGNTSK